MDARMVDILMAVGGGCSTILLGIIAFFIVKAFKELEKNTAVTNELLVKMGIVEAKMGSVQREVAGLQRDVAAAQELRMDIAVIKSKLGHANGKVRKDF